METLDVVAHHGNHHQYYGRSRSRSYTKLRSFGSPPSGGFQGINCRTFESGEGLLPTPFKSCSTKTPITRKAVPSFSPKTPSPHGNENQKPSKRIAKTSTIPIPIAIDFDPKEGEYDFSERWAGPAYSNSPCPSSLPIPKFSMRPKRTVSLDLPKLKLASEFDFHSIAKSAPVSPTRERSPSPSDLFDFSDSATKTLRRILNLDITD